MSLDELVTSKKFKKKICDLLQKASDDGEQVTKKSIRRELEKNYGLDNKALDAHKDVVGEAVSDFLNHESEGEAEAEASPPKKKAKKNKKEVNDDVDDSQPAKKPKLTVITKSGSEAPKQLGKLQENSMSGQDFMAAAEEMSLEVFGNKLTGEPRTFSSGAYGWYLGGKIEVEVPGQGTVWAQLGINCSIVGSKNWD
jgi:hypothetical protein